MDELTYFYPQLMTRLNIQHINQTASSGMVNRKFYVYVLIGFLIALIQAVEDFTEVDAVFQNIVLEFLLFVPFATILFYLYGNYYKSSLSYLRSNRIIKIWSYKDIKITMLWIVPNWIILFFVVSFISASMPEDMEDKNIFNVYWLIWVASLIFLSITIAVELFSESIENRQHLELKYERLSRSHEMAKYQALMNQINPHFLFNSLNVLSFLVYQSPQEAERFIEELSNIYRYILQLNEKYVVPLKKELDFIESYIFLQKIRYQNNLTFDADIDSHSTDKMIPPLTLELLVENAIKHNVIAEDQPLNIKLFTENGHLVVKNNLQPRMEPKNNSMQIGLKNLLEKFEILDMEPPQFFNSKGDFVVKVPLINV